LVGLNEGLKVGKAEGSQVEHLNLLVCQPANDLYAIMLEHFFSVRRIGKFAG
jgi:hypothetical protein